MKAQDMYIHLNGLKLYAYHGVFPQENRIGAEYTLNLRLKTDFSHAAENDCLEGTVNYGLLLVGKGVEVAPHVFQPVDYLQRAARARAFEEHVLHEVRHAVFAGQFVARTGIHHHPAVSHRRLRRAVHQPKPIGACISLIFQYSYELF